MLLENLNIIFCTGGLEIEPIRDIFKHILNVIGLYVADKYFLIYSIFAHIARTKILFNLAVKLGCRLYENFCLKCGFTSTVVRAAMKPHPKARFSAIQFRYLLGNLFEAPFSPFSLSPILLCFTGHDFALNG